MKAKKHIEFDRVFAYLTEGKTDILWFESEEVMREFGHLMVELARSDEHLQEDGDLVMTKDYDDNGIWVNFTHRPIYHQNIRFKNEKQMRRAGQCLIDLARIGGNEVEIKTKGPKD
jgi:hypothetical protein